MTIAVLGCGDWGKNLVRNFFELDALSAIVDSAPAARQRASELAPGVRVYEDVAAVLRDPNIRGVVVATPADTHARLSAAALRAGKDVLCEKPLALRYEDAREVSAIAAEHSRVLMAGHILEYHPAIQRLRQLIADGELGAVRYVYSTRLNLGKVWLEENILWALAPHDISVILRLVDAMPFQVVSTGGACIQPNVFDVSVTQLLFENGVAAHVFVSWLHPFKEQKLVVVGSKRMAVFDDVRRELVVYDQRVDVHGGEPVPIRGEGRLVEYSNDEPLKLECRAFLDAMRSREPPLTGVASTMRVMRVLQAAQRSLVTRGQPVTLPME